MDLDVARRLAVALALGLIIGAERGWQDRDREEGGRVVGLRSFALIGLFGGVSAVLGEAFGAAVLIAGFAGLTLLVCVSYAVSAPRTGHFGATTELAAFLTFTLAALSASGHAVEAAAAAVVSAALLSAKAVLHRTLEAIQRQELDATLQLLLIALVVLPLLPDRGFGPGEALNPRSIGFYVLLIAGISFAGYLGVKLLGDRLGILITALLGGLTSSTAVTLAFSRIAARSPAQAPWLAVGIALACATMAPRLLFEVSVVNRALLPALAPPLAALFAVPLLGALLLLRRSHAHPEAGALTLRNPLQLGAALWFAAVLALLFVLSHFAQARFGDRGVYLLAAASALTDVDAVSLSLARMARGELAPEVASRGILLAALVNTAFKACLAAAIGGLALARWAGLLLGSALLAASATALFTLR